jgi:hypothetical protein
LLSEHLALRGTVGHPDGLRFSGSSTLKLLQLEAKPLFATATPRSALRLTTLKGMENIFMIAVGQCTAAMVFNVREENGEQMSSVDRR